MWRHRQLALATACLTSLLIAGTLLVPCRAAAQPGYPSRPVRIIVPYPLGAHVDIVARQLAPYMQEALGQSFFVENRAGAAGRIGAAAVAQAAPDGYTLLLTTEVAIVIAPHIGVSMSYDPLRDLTPITLLTQVPVMLAVHPDTAVRKLSDYISLARISPGQLLFASSGVGGPNHLAGELFKHRTGLDIVHVPFQGTWPALQAVISNQVGSLWATASALLPYVASGALRPIAVGSLHRSPSLPNVPTVIESGVADFETVSWIGLLAPAGLDRKLLLELSSSARAGLKTREIADLLTRDGSEMVASSPAEFASTIEADYARYASLAGLFRQLRP